jgi:membrane-bound ClpP family serine protease
VSDLFWPTVFLALALLLMSLELFIPSGGLIGVGALVCLGLGLWNAFQTSRRLGMVFLLVDFVVVPTTAIAALRLWVRSPLGRRFALAPPRPDEIDVSHAHHSAEDLVGSIGRALTPLHPCGHVQVDGRRRDGISESGLIADGARIRVVGVRSGQLVVRSIESPAAEERPFANGDPSPSTLDLGAGL